MKSDVAGCFLLVFYVLATYMVISGWGLARGSAHSWHLYITLYPIQSHYPDTDLTSPCPILLMPNTRLGSDKYQFYKSLVLLDWEATYLLIYRQPAPHSPDWTETSCPAAEINCKLIIFLSGQCGNI